MRPCEISKFHCRRYLDGHEHANQTRIQNAIFAEHTRHFLQKNLIPTWYHTDVLQVQWTLNCGAVWHGAVTMVWLFLKIILAYRYMYCIQVHVFTEIRLVFKKRFLQRIEGIFVQVLYRDLVQVLYTLVAIQKKHFKLCTFILALFCFKWLKLLFILHENVHAIGLKFVHYVGVVLSHCPNLIGHNKD